MLPPRSRRLLPWLVVPVVVALCLLGVQRALTAPVPTSPADAYLPADGTSSYLRSIGTSTPSYYGVEQAVLRGADLALSTSDVGFAAAGLGADDPRLEQRWLRVSINDVAAKSTTETISLVATSDGLELVLDEYAGGYVAYRPALPVITPDLLAGRTVHYTGTRVEQDAQRAVTADLTAAPSSAGCTDVRVDLHFVHADATDVALLYGFCEHGGFAGLEVVRGDDHSGARRTDDSPALSAPDTAIAVPDWAAPTRPARSEVAFGQLVGELSPIFLDGSLLVAAEDDVVIATGPGDLLLATYLPKSKAYGVFWRARPGGDIVRLTAAGEVSVAATSQKALVGYDFNGARRWRTQLSDLAVGLSATTFGVLATLADGSVSMLDPATGAVRWRTDVGQDAIGAAAHDGDTAYVLDGQTDLHAYDLATGKERWHVGRTEGDRVGVAGDAVLTYHGETTTWDGWAATDGARRFSLDVPGQLYTYGSTGNRAVISTEDGVTALDPGGRVAWRAPVRGSLSVSGTRLAACDLQVCELRDGDTGAVEATWELDGPLLNAPTVVFTARGLLLAQKPLRGPVAFRELR